jgi:hypothetical protein
MSEGTAAVADTAARDGPITDRIKTEGTVPPATAMMAAEGGAEFIKRIRSMEAE